MDGSCGLPGKPAAAPVERSGPGWSLPTASEKAHRMLIFRYMTQGPGGHLKHRDLVFDAFGLPTGNRLASRPPMRGRADSGNATARP